MVKNTAFLKNQELTMLSRNELSKLIKDRTLSWVRGRLHSYGNLYLQSESKQNFALICLITFKARIMPENSFVMKIYDNKFSNLDEAICFVSKEVSDRGYLVKDFKS